MINVFFADDMLLLLFDISLILGYRFPSFVPSMTVTRTGIPLDYDLLLFSVSTVAIGENTVFGSVWEISLDVFSMVLLI